MLRRVARAVGVAAVGLTLAGCPGFGDETLEDRAGLDGTPTWEADVAPVFAQYCWSCHGETPCCDAPSALFGYEQVYAVRSLIEREVVDFNRMPPGVGLPDPPRAVIAAWLRGGAPRGEPRLDAGAPDAGPRFDFGPLPGDGPVPTWNGEVGPLMVERCATEFCHVGAHPQGGLDLSTYEGFEAGGFAGDLRGGGDPSRSLLVRRLLGQGGPLMPLTGDPFTEAQIRLVARWIAAGAPRGE